ncbi:MAG TPA: FtsX-like permease family protein [Bacteroidales bacterium]|nr:FtsX-like permease family protein [Bacteroidales bacterium]
MFTNFLKTTSRYLWRNKSYTILNYICLTFGLTCSFAAALNVLHVLTFDRFHENYDRLYAVEANVTYFNGDRFPKPYLSASLPDLIQQNVPEFEKIVRESECQLSFKNGDEIFSESGIYTDPAFLDIFSFPLITGEKTKVLSDNKAIAITEKMALKFFKTTDCLGKTLIVKNDSGEEAFVISGILKDIPEKSSIRFDFIIPFSTFLSANPQALNPDASSTTIWALLNKNNEKDVANAKIQKLISSQEATLNQELFLFPLKEQVLYDYAGGKRVWDDMRQVVILGVIGFAILLIACFNFINLTIAMNIKRYKEVGIKKVLGAQKSTIVIHQLGEAFLIVFLSMVTAIDLSRLVISLLNRALNGNIQFELTNTWIVLAFITIGFFAALASGLLPALYLSSSRPVEILKGNVSNGHSFSAFRKSLIIFQFTIPVAIIICMLIVRVQDKYLRNFDLGFDKEKMLVIPATPAIQAHHESLRNDLLQIPDVEYVSFTNCIPANGTKVTNEVSWEGKDPSTKLHFWRINTDFSFSDVVNLKISGGRFFNKSFSSDSTCFLINDIAAKVVGYDEPLGKVLPVDGQRGSIIGVFRDFHTLDLSGPFTPTIISISERDNNKILVRFTKGDISLLTSHIRDILKKYDLGNTIQPVLYPDILRRSEMATISLIAGLSFFVSILLACMGLSGLASFTAQRRTKEIGIRKINGASVVSILKLLGMNYSKLFIIASCISIPIAFILGSFFLMRYNFRTPMPYWTLLIGPIAGFLIAILTITVQSLRTATKNPVETLRYE